MEAKNPIVKMYSPKSKDRRPYGTAPLDLDLPQALEVMNKIAQEGRSMPESKLALILGNTITSSAFPRKVRALVAYGLLAELSDANYVLSELALSIAYPRSAEAQLESKKASFLRIEQFAFLFNQHKGKLLPADEFLRNIIEQEYKIPRDVSDVWIRQFKNGAKAAGLFHGRSDGKIQISESPMSTETVAEAVVDLQKFDPSRVDNDLSFTPAPAASEAVPIYKMAASGHATRIQLSGGQLAEFSIPDKLSSKDADKLKKALQGIATIIDSMVSEP